MVSVQFGVNGAIDIATGDEVKGYVDSGIDRVLGRIPPPEQGIYLRPPASYNLATPTTGTFILDFGDPAPNTVWKIQEVVVTAADDRTAPAGALAALYCGPAGRQSGLAAVQDLPSLGQLVRPAIAVPGVFQFGSPNGWTVHFGQSLTVVYYSPTTPVSVISAVATVVQYTASAVSYNRTPSGR